nr:aldehyde dehydrogenase family protein [Angustibacter aerolatus]
MRSQEVDDDRRGAGAARGARGAGQRPGVGRVRGRRVGAARGRRDLHRARAGDRAGHGRGAGGHRRGSPTAPSATPAGRTSRAGATSPPRARCGAAQGRRAHPRPRRRASASLEAREVGKPRRDALRFDVSFASAGFDFYAGLTDTLHGEVIDQGPIEARVHYEPYGVVAAILPFNWPPIHFAKKARAGARGGQHRGDQAGRAGAADGAAAGRDRQRGAAARRRERGGRSPGRCGAGRAPGGRADHLHRRDVDRPRGAADGGREPHLRHDGAWAARTPSWCSTTPTSTPPSTW